MYFKWLVGSLLIATLFAALHFWALTDFLYWKYRWFDIPMHELGGVAVGALTISLLYSYRPRMYLLIVATVVVLWEIMELAAGITVYTRPDYAWDTAHDLLNGALGATATYVLARYTLWRSA